jgi:hypothetical protein
MSRHNSLPGDYQAQCTALLEAAWPGVKVLLFGFDNFRWQLEPRFDLKVTGAERDLIRAGLLGPAAAASIPPCGACHREGWKINRGKTRTRLESWDEEKALDLVAPVLIDAMVWRPPQPA